MWTFQMLESGWLTPGLLFQTGNQSAGSITTTSYSDQIVGDATAAAAWQAYIASGKLPLLTQFQIRVPYFSIYSIVAFDGVNTFTIDRPWMEPDGTAQSYMIYQCYFPAPVLDFKRFFEIRDTSNNAPLDYWTYGRQDASIGDAQRTAFNQPCYVLPFKPDTRAGSATLGYMLYELWPHPLSVLPYTMSYLRRGAPLVLPSDAIPAPLTEDMVKWKAREAAYIWKESQKGESVARGAGADFKFLVQAAAAKYRESSQRIASRDADLAALYFKRFVRWAATDAWGDGYANILGQLNVGNFR
jgi:hypothetical protein